MTDEQRNAIDKTVKEAVILGDVIHFYDHTAWVPPYDDMAVDVVLYEELSKLAGGEIYDVVYNHGRASGRIKRIGVK